MSSLDRFPDWSLFAERPVPGEIDLLSPSSEAGALLQASQALLEAERKAADEIRQQGIAALAQQAVLVVRFALTLERHRQKLEESSLLKVYRSLAIVKDQQLEALGSAGLEILIPQGRRLDEIANYVDVAGWRHHEDFSEEVVAEVLEPVVWYQGRLAHTGVVIMGAPKEKEPAVSS
ncbi:MAG TPA: hypothetical protein VFV38_02895 [Ktedonobacteraceae bacterium]|nr:hypothetical protein [Ktedonobacteraceae bacterium]